jgi:hypothetical protein
MYTGVPPFGGFRQKFLHVQQSLGFVSCLLFAKHRMGKCISFLRSLMMRSIKIISKYNLILLYIEMLLFEKRNLDYIFSTNVTSYDFMCTVVFLLALFKFPIEVTMVSALFILIYQYKLYRFTQSINKTYKAESGDILIFFSHNNVDLAEWVIWDGMLTTHTTIPARHYAVVLDDKYFIETRHPDIEKYDNITGDVIRGFPRLAKLKHIRKDWSVGEIMVIKTGKTFDHTMMKDVRNFFENKKGYWEGGACIGTLNELYDILDKDHPLFLSVEDIMGYYTNAQIGYLE